MCKRCRRKRLGGGLPQQVLTRAPSSQTITVFLGHQNVWQIVHGGSWPCLLGEEMCLWEAAISEARLGPQKGLGGADKIVSPSSSTRRGPQLFSLAPWAVVPAFRSPWIGVLS